MNAKAMMNAALRGKPYAGNPHGRFDEGEVVIHGDWMMKHVILAVVSMLIAAGSPVLADTVGWWHFNGTPGADATSIPSVIDNDHPAVLQTVSGFPNAKFSAESRGEIPCGLDGSGNFVKYDGSSAGSVYLSVTNSTTGEVKGLWYKVSASDLFKTKVVDGETKRAAFTVEIISRHAAVNMPGPRGMNIATTRASTNYASFLFMFCGISSCSQFRADTKDMSNYISNVWTYDNSSDPFPFDGRWHHMAIVYDGEGTTKIYRDYVEKWSQSGKPLSEDAGDLIIGPGANTGIRADNMFSVDEVRISDTALSPSEFMHSAYSGEVEDSFAYWTFDAPGMAGTDVGTEYGAVKSITGYPAFDLCGATYTNNVNGVFAKNWDPNGDYQPRFSGDVKSAYVWDAASCRIANPANSTSVFFRHASEAGASQQSTIGSSLHTACLASPFPAASNITVECFLKTDKTFTGNVSGLFRLISYPGPSYKACIDMVFGKTPRAIISDAAGEKITGPNVGDGDWHHVAMNYDISSGTSTVCKLWVDYQYIGMGERIGAVTFDWNSVYIALGASPNGYAYSGWIDELRISRGDIGEEHFLRAFTPRADLTGAWLVQTNATLTGAEWFSPDTSYLNARWNDGDVALADMGSKFLKLGGNTVAVDKSVAFSGVGGMTIPYAAFIGTNVFTVEANVRGSGTVFAKKRDGGTSWSVGSAANGKAELKVNDAATATSATLSDGRWHHVALVVDLASSNMATLYVDCAVAASTSASAMVVDAGDLVLGEDFAGEMAGVRFSPGIVAPESFMVLRPPSGMVLFVR